MNFQKYRSHRRQVYKTGTIFGVGPNTARYLGLILLSVFSLLFLIQSAQGSDRALELRQLEEKKLELEKDLATLEVNATRWQSLQILNESATKQGLVPITSIETLNVDN